MKPTWGLVPYSGILGLHAEIDHCGPMARTVRDNALLLQAIAGPDGMDDRQPRSMPAESLKYWESLEQFLTASESKAKPLEGLRIGVLKEGFAMPMLDSHVDKAVRSAITDLATLGAEVVEVSVPEHDKICVSWTCTQALAGGRDGLLGDRTGRKELYMTDIAAGPSGLVSQERFDTWGAGAQNLYMKHLYVLDKYGAVVHAKATNMIRKQTRAYDAVLGSLDALVMPTIPFPPTPSFREGEKHGPLERLVHMAGTILNTAPFNATGHPALSLPVGFVPAVDDESVRLPAALQIVGKQFEELTCLKIAAAWERSKDWKSLSF
jgi:amidase